MNHFRQSLPVGAERLDDGGWRFRLWAPSARRISLCLEGREREMHALDDGWFERIDAAAAGSRYHYRIDDELAVPDPASRQQAGDVHGDSLLVDPRSYAWQHAHGCGRPWREVVAMELHVGCCGGFAGVAAQLPRLAALGITAVELMPVAAFPGIRNWGYDGVLPFAPAAAYGTPDELKALVDTAHGLELCIYLDVVYNHFGPDGNYLHRYASAFFDAGKQSPWGAAIDFARPEVRAFFTANALYWLHEYRFDGLRLDAVHAIGDPGWLDEMAATVRASLEPGRHVHLMLENDHNRASHLRGDFDAQWNDDAHNALHVLLTGEHEGYYADYRDQPLQHLARCLAEGFAFQGEVPPIGNGRSRGEPSADLSPCRFMLFLQNHDQIGNRAGGERLTTLVEPAALRAAIVLQLLAPQVPLLFMGEEFGCRRPFLFFTDFHDELADAVREGRRREFAAFSAFASDEARARIADPNDPQTFLRSCPDFAAVDAEADAPARAGWIALYRELLALRHRHIVPALDDARSLGVDLLGERALLARWQLGDAVLAIALNLGRADVTVMPGSGSLLYESADGSWSALQRDRLPGLSACAFLQRHHEAEHA